MSTSSHRPFWSWFLSVDGREHAVDDEEFARRTGSGGCAALCGHPVRTQSLTVPPGPRCDRCLLVVRARATLPELPPPEPPRRRVPALLWRLLRPARSAATAESRPRRPRR